MTKSPSISLQIMLLALFIIFSFNGCEGKRVDSKDSAVAKSSQNSNSVSNIVESNIEQTSSVESSQDSSTTSTTPKMNMQSYIQELEQAGYVSKAYINNLKSYEASKNLKAKLDREALQSSHTSFLESLFDINADLEACEFIDSQFGNFNPSYDIPALRRFIYDEGTKQAYMVEYASKEQSKLTLYKITKTALRGEVFSLDLLELDIPKPKGDLEQIIKLAPTLQPKTTQKRTLSFLLYDDKGITKVQYFFNDENLLIEQDKYRYGVCNGKVSFNNHFLSTQILDSKKLWGKWIKLEKPKHNEACKTLAIDKESLYLVTYKRKSLEHGDDDFDYMLFDKESQSIEERLHWADYYPSYPIILQERDNTLLFIYNWVATSGVVGTDSYAIKILSDDIIKLNDKGYYIREQSIEKLGVPKLRDDEMRLDE